MTGYSIRATLNSAHGKSWCLTRKASSQLALLVLDRPVEPTAAHLLNQHISALYCYDIIVELITIQAGCVRPKDMRKAALPMPWRRRCHFVRLQNHNRERLFEVKSLPWRTVRLRASCEPSLTFVRQILWWPDCRCPCKWHSVKFRFVLRR